MTDLNELYVQQVKQDLYDQIKALQERVGALEKEIERLKNKP